MICVIPETHLCKMKNVNQSKYIGALAVGIGPIYLIHIYIFVPINTYTAKPVCWNEWISDSYCSLKPLMLRHGGSSAGSYLADPTSPIPSHCAVIILFQSVAVHQLS